MESIRFKCAWHTSLPVVSVASGTTTANANTAFLISSQRELTETFGDPKFYTDASGTALNGYELNEYLSLIHI